MSYTEHLTPISEATYHEQTQYGYTGDHAVGIATALDGKGNGDSFGNWLRDTYRWSAPALDGVIEKISIIWTAHAGNSWTGAGETGYALRLGGTDFCNVTIPKVHDLPLNPKTGLPWTKDDLTYPYFEAGTIHRHSNLSYSYVDAIDVIITYSGKLSFGLKLELALSIPVNPSTGNGTIVDTGGEDCDRRGFVYSPNPHPDPGNVAPESSGYETYVEELGSFGTGAFDDTLTGITPTTHYTRAYAHNSGGFAYGNEVTFSSTSTRQSIFTIDPVWTDVTSYLMDLYIKRGRNHLLDKCEAGTALFTLNNATGNWWRNNTAGAFYNDIRPLTLIRLRGSYDTISPLFYGVMESIEPNWLEQRGGFTPIITLSCVDILKTFAKYRIVNANPALTDDVTAGEDFVYVTDTYGLVEGQTIRLYDDNNTENLIIQQVVPATKVVIFTTNIVHDYAMGDNAAVKKWPAVLSGTRMHDIVLEIGWPLALCTLDTGTVIVIELSPAAGGSNALEEMYATTEAEDGNIFVSANGFLIFHDNDARTVEPYNQSQFTMIDDGTGNSFAHPELIDDDEFIYNEASISGDGIYEQVMLDSTAQAEQGPRAISRKNSLLYNDHDAVRQCLMLVLRYKASTMRCKALHVLPDADPDLLYPLVMENELVTRMTLQINSTRNPAVINQQYHIEGLTHRWSPRKGWLTTWQLWETARYRSYNTYHDGFLANNSDVSYEDCHDAASASQPAYNDDAMGLNAGQWLTYAGAIFLSARIERGVVEFDTTNILATETIEEAYILVRAEAIFNTRAWSLRLVSNYTVECPVEQSDYFLLKGAETAHATEIPAEAPAGWKVFEVNALGISNMVKEGITRFGLRSDKDVDASDSGALSKEFMTLGGKGYYAGKYQMQLIVKIKG